MWFFWNKTVTVSWHANWLLDLYNIQVRLVLVDGVESEGGQSNTALVADLSLRVVSRVRIILQDPEGERVGPSQTGVDIPPQISAASPAPSQPRRTMLRPGSGSRPQARGRDRVILRSNAAWSRLVLVVEMVRQGHGTGRSWESGILMVTELHLTRPGPLHVHLRGAEKRSGDGLGDSREGGREDGLLNNRSRSPVLS